VFEYNADNMLTLYRFFDEEYQESYAVEIEYTDKRPSKITEKEYWDDEESLYQRRVFAVTYTGGGMYVNLTDTSGIHGLDVELTVNSAGRMYRSYNLYWGDEILYQYDANGNYMGITGHDYDIFEYDISKSGIFANTATPNWVPTYCGFWIGFFCPNLLVKNNDTVIEWTDLNQDGYYTKMTEIYDDGDRAEYMIKYITTK